MTTACPIHVLGIGLEGASGLDESRLNILAQATLLVGSDRHLNYFPDHPAQKFPLGNIRSEEHTSELQSLTNLVCRLLLEKKKKKNYTTQTV